MEEQILSGLRGSKSERDSAIRSLVRNEDLKRSINGFVLNNSGDKDDVVMVLTDAIISFAKLVFKNKDFQLKSGLISYLMGIAKYKWLDELRKRKNSISTAELSHTNIEGVYSSQLDIIIKGQKAELIRSVLDKMKVNCKQVIMYWSAKYKMVEIAKLLGYKSEGVVRKKKSECMKELINYLADKPLVKQQLRG